MASLTPNIDKLEAVIRSLGSDPTVSFQMRTGEATGFFTVTAGRTEDTRCAIGQGDTLAEALTAMKKDLAALNAKVSLAGLEKVAA